MDKFQELNQRLSKARQQEDSTAKADWAAGLYQEAASLIGVLKDFQDECKEVLTEVIIETGDTSFRTSTAKVLISSPSKRVYYDAKGLDRLAERDEKIKKAIYKYRKETSIDGGLRIQSASNNRKNIGPAQKVGD